jgi:hypothetical protein
VRVVILNSMCARNHKSGTTGLGAENPEPNPK